MVGNATEKDVAFATYHKNRQMIGRKRCEIRTFTIMARVATRTSRIELNTVRSGLTTTLSRAVVFVSPTDSSVGVAFREKSAAAPSERGVVGILIVRVLLEKVTNVKLDGTRMPDKMPLRGSLYRVTWLALIIHSEPVIAFR